MPAYGAATSTTALSFLLVLCILRLSSSYYSHLLDRTLSSHALLMSTIATSRANSIDPSISNSFDNFSRNLQPTYKSNPMSSRSELMTKLTSSNKKDFNKGYELRTQYIKSRLMSREEERTAGRFNVVGRKLTQVKTLLQEQLGRDPTAAEWAAASSLTEQELVAYNDLAVRARQRLVQHNLRLVDFWTRRLIEHSASCKDISYYELVTEGVIGLLAAAERYDGRAPFIKYAQSYVRNELYRGMTRLRPGSFLSHNTVMLSFRAKRATDRLREELGREPTVDEIATVLNCSTKKLKEELNVMALKRTVISAQSNAQGNMGQADGAVQSRSGGSADGSIGDRPSSYLDLFQNPDHSMPNTEFLQWKIDFHQAVETSLNAVEKRTLSIRYGLGNDGQNHSIDRTAELMCVSTEGTRKIILRAMEKLRDSPFGAVLAEGPPSKGVANDFSGRQLTRAAY